MKKLIIAYTLVLVAAALHAQSVRAESPAHQGSVAANWCNYLGPDCRPYGLSPKAYNVFRYLTQPEGMPGYQRYEASRELARAQEQIAKNDLEACREGRDIAKAMRHSPSPDMRRRGRRLFDLIGEKCE